MSSAVSSPTSSSTKSRHHSTSNTNASNAANTATTSSSNSSSRRSSTTASPSTMLLRLLNVLTIVLRIIIWPLKQLLEAANGGNNNNLDGLSPAVSAKAAQQFVSHLRSLASSTASSSTTSQPQQQQQQQHADNTSTSGATNNSNTLNAWTTVGFDAARLEASQNQALLLVYLHSPLHRLSNAFCTKIFCNTTNQNNTSSNNSSSIATFLSEQPHISAVGFSIHSAQGAHLAQLLQAHSFPFIALLQPKPSSTTTTATAAGTPAAASPGAMNLLFRAEGPALLSLRPEDLLHYWTLALQRHEIALQEFEARRLQRQEEQELRRQQDEEYQAALRADQERERRVREATEQEALATQAAQEQQAQKEAQAEALLRETQALVPPEPPASASNSSNIRFVLPSGTKLNRRFAHSDTIRNCKAYIRMYYHERSMPIGTIGLFTNFPRQCYNDNDDQTLAQAGLVAPQAVLMVQDLDA